MTYLHEVVDEGELHDLIYDGMITRRSHPDFLNLEIYNYTAAAQYSGLLKESETARVCRGLIVDTTTGKIVARPFAKFFNFGELDNIDLSEKYWVTDKLDGSLGIGYLKPHNDHPDPLRRWQIATRGSFTSEQALWANEKIKDTPQYFSCFPRDYTPLFEIIYPGNRIVLDYGDEERITLLGMVNNETGTFIPYVEHEKITVGWPLGVNVPLYEQPMTLAEALNLPDRKNAEGLVLVNKITGDLIKLKQDDYVQLHKIIFNLSTVAIWEALSTNAFDDFILNIPDEVFPEVKKTADSLYEQYLTVLKESAGVHHRILKESQIEGQLDRKTYATKLLNLDYEHYGICFRLLDKKDTHELAWKAVKPKHEIIVRMKDEENE